MNQRMIYQIRRDTIEEYIAFYEAKGDFTTGQALRRLARELAMPLDEDVLQRLVHEKGTG